MIITIRLLLGEPMTKINCWNEYDTLKSIILGSVYDLDKIPRIYNTQDQDAFEKIVEETAAELNKIQIVLELLHIQKVIIIRQPLIILLKIFLKEQHF